MTGTAYAIEPAGNDSRRWPAVELTLLAAALALLQVAVAGYAVGVGNQTIQIPYLLHLMDPQLFAADPAIADTIERYPSWCFRLLAPLCAVIGWPLAYAALHLLSGWALHGALLILAQRCFGSPWSGALAGVMLVVGHQHGVAGGDTYYQGFTHTWLALPWALWATIAAWERRWLIAGLLLGLLFDLHALLAAYAVVLAAAGALVERRQGDLRALALTAAVAVVAAAPTLWSILIHRGEIDQRWFALMAVRSSHHSFPLSLWTAGEDAIPRFALLLGIAAASLGLVEDIALRRRAAGVLAACLALLVIGAIGTGSATILKAQLWRCSALVVPLALVLIGHGACRAWDLSGWRGRSLGAAFVVAVAALALPGLGGALWLGLAAVTAAGLTARLVTWPMALVLGGAHAVAIAAAVTIDHPLVDAPTLGHEPDSPLLALAAGLALVALGLRRALPVIDHGPRLQRLVLGAGLLIPAVLHVAGQREPTGDEWVALQLWAQRHTPPDAVVLTPPLRPGFRIHSHRSVVTEWRDGTQLYFAPSFADTWWERMTALQPGIELDVEARTLRAGGSAYATLSDEEIQALCERTGAGWVVLPATRETRLVHAVTSGSWQLCRAELTPPPPPPPPPTGQDAEIQRFMAEVVEPNIRRHRTGTLRLELRDPSGRALKDLPWELVQVDSAFGFGCGIGHFVEPPKRREKGFKAPVVDRELLRWFRPLFNYSTIPYSAKWVYLEPEPDVRSYDDLDAYVAWCEAQGVVPEYHFVTGYEPDWMKGRPKDEQKARLMDHTRAVIERYGDRIPYWQVVNEKKYLRESPEVFALFRELLPEAKLGISDCARFFSDKPEGSAKRERDLLRGMDEVRWLREQGVELDFFAVHAHRPFGLWADFEQAYEVLDAFQAEGLRVHISEFGIHSDHKITGDQRHGHWNRELQAEYYELMFRLLYSHPVVDVINLWGFTGQTWMGGAGFLDGKGEPTPAYHRLKRLITEEWRSRAEGTLDLTGAIETRGFHGDYELTLQRDDGDPIVIPLTHTDGDTTLRIVVDPATGSARTIDTNASPQE